MTKPMHRPTPTKWHGARSLASPAHPDVVFNLPRIGRLAAAAATASGPLSVASDDLQFAIRRLLNVPVGPQLQARAELDLRNLPTFKDDLREFSLLLATIASPAARYSQGVAYAPRRSIDRPALRPAVAAPGSSPAVLRDRSGNTFASLLRPQRVSSPRVHEAVLERSIPILDLLDLAVERSVIPPSLDSDRAYARALNANGRQAGVSVNDSNIVKPLKMLRFRLAGMVDCVLAMKLSQHLAWVGDAFANTSGTGFEYAVSSPNDKRLIGLGAIRTMLDLRQPKLWMGDSAQLMDAVRMEVKLETQLSQTRTMSRSRTISRDR